MNEAGDTLSRPGPAIPPSARERAVEALTRGYAEDQLTEDELEERLDRAYRATTLAELEALTANLPVARTAETRAAATAAAKHASKTSLAPAPRRIKAVLSGHEAVVAGPVPRRMSVKSVMGYVELDMRRADFEPGVTVVDVRSVMGYVRILLPTDVRVESDGRALLGYFSFRGGSSPGVTDRERVVRITGRAVMGYAECFAVSRKESLPSSNSESP